MNELTKEQILEVKAMGFLRNRGTDCFSGRVVVAGGVFTSEQMEVISRCAKECGNGKVVFTTRMTAEIVGIPYEKISQAKAMIEADGPAMAFGGTGAKVRPITACKGTTCVYGTYDTQALAKEIHERYYLNQGARKLPHKFKIAVGGCPNSCIKPSLNDFGIEPRWQQGKLMFKIYVGGTWGKKTRNGDVLSQLVPEDGLFSVIEGVMDWFQANANPKERLGMAIDRLGVDSLEAALFAAN